MKRSSSIVAGVVGRLLAVSSLLSPLLAPLGCAVDDEPLTAVDEAPLTTAHKLYVNFDGATLKAAPKYDPALGETPQDDAAEDVSAVVSGPIRPFADERFPSGAKARILELVRRYLAPFNVDVVTTRPTEGLYTMVVVGGTPAPPVTFVHEGVQPNGIGALDCDNRNKSGVGVAFAEGILAEVKSDGFASFAERPGTDDDVERWIAVTIVHEAGHTWGLMHIDTPNSIMHYWSNNIIAVGDEDWLPGPVVADEKLMKVCRGPDARPFEWEDDPRAILLRTLGPRSE